MLSLTLKGFLSQAISRNSNCQEIIILCINNGTAFIRYAAPLLAKQATDVNAILLESGAGKIKKAQAGAWA